MGIFFAELRNEEIEEHYHFFLQGKRMLSLFLKKKSKTRKFIFVSFLLFLIRNYLNQIKDNNWIAISFLKIFKMQFCCLVCWIIPLHWKSKQGETKRLKDKCYNIIEFNNEKININPKCILTNYVRLRAKS